MTNALNTMNTINRTIQLNNLSKIVANGSDLSVGGVVIAILIGIVLSVGAIALVHWLLNR
jgi:uncharacterized protein YacL